MKRAADSLREWGYALIVFDAYHPAQAVERCKMSIITIFSGVTPPTEYCLLSADSGCSA
ncbi:MAG: hypothetical protein FWF87_04855 [Synergistaceae bacterium]|nr:hypothetical protein [Synergistaceae bacterium]